MAAIHVISPSEFKQNQKKFFDLALSERVVIKRGIQALYRRERQSERRSLF